MLILREAFAGTSRFDAFQAKLEIGRTLLSDRLTRLVEEGIFERTRYSERPERFEYRLTDKGRDLNVALTGLRQWGDKYLSEAPPRILRRKSDHAPVVAAFVLEGTETLRPEELETVAS
jgi:DNA-binding HxlR family transcriptional regulator